MTTDWDAFGEPPKLPTEEEKKAAIELTKKKCEESRQKLKLGESKSEELFVNQTVSAQKNDAKQPLNPPKQDIICTREELEAKRIVTLYELLNSDIPEQEYFIDKIIPERSVTLLAAKAGDFKSFLALCMACCLISGKSFLNLNTKKCKVLYIDEENDDIELLRRLQKLYISMNIKRDMEDNLGLAIFKNIKINTSDGSEMLKKLIEEFRPNVIIVDSLIRVFVGDENASGDMRKVFDTVKVLMKKYNTTWIFLHHVVKKSGFITMPDIRGSGDIVAQMSSVLILNRQDENTFILNQGKCRGEPKPIPPIELTAYDTDYGGIEIKYKGTAKRQLTTIELAAKDIEKWIVEKNKQDFKSGEVYEEFKEVHDENAIRDGLKKVCEKGIIKTNGRGKWKRPSSII
jgi:RecA-family ATPase